MTAVIDHSPALNAAVPKACWSSGTWTTATWSAAPRATAAHNQRLAVDRRNALRVCERELNALTS